MLLKTHPWYGQIRFIFKPCNITLNIFQDSLYLHILDTNDIVNATNDFYTLFWQVQSWKPKFNSCVSYNWRKYRDGCAEKSSIKTFSGNFSTLSTSRISRSFSLSFQCMPLIVYSLILSTPWKFKYKPS